jgi:hypothetical protein
VGIPPQVEAAFRVLGYALDVERGTADGGKAGKGRALSEAEAAVRAAALELIRKYLTEPDPAPADWRGRVKREGGG